MERTKKVLEIDAPLAIVFDLYSDFEKFPEWMKNIKEVRRTGKRLTRWTAEAPLMDVEWEAETTTFEPNRRISWRTVRGDVEMEGDVFFEETESGTTRMNISLGYEPPAGRLGSLVAHLLGSDPEKQIDEDFKKFAQTAERRARSLAASEEKQSPGKDKQAGERKAAA
ncbi:MAG TPA: SRPBCC family protein [Pyrinomonadaceae bacterium]|nr:SRPBCC family protein [Pyrinomonadaceae bacterium]